MRHILYRLGGAIAVALVALVPVFAAQAAPPAAPASTQAPATPAPATPAAATPAPANNSGATSAGGSFFTPPVAAKGQPRQAATGNALAAAEVPEPAMIGLFGAGLAGLAFARMRARRRPGGDGIAKD
ncbi:hypothetical protein DMP17_09020 [Pseudonocardia sp. TMWB2A]|uniref:PEP-CTERM sorting domain-containing protein n=1 Tax=Pseudonocardia sp. TMWB2A TaxID=687430 RepID=UPI00307F84BE